VVVGLGVVWEHSSAAGWITPPPPPAGKIGGGPPGGTVVLGPGQHLPSGAQVPAGTKIVHVNQNVGDRGMWFDLSQVGNLTHTVEVVAAVMAWVVVYDVARRRWRKARRAAATSASSPET
jgi:hypothetical protein